MPPQGKRVVIRHTLIGRCSKCGGIQVAVVETDTWLAPLPYEGPEPCLRCALEKAR